MMAVVRSQSCSGRNRLHYNCNLTEIKPFLKHCSLDVQWPLKGTEFMLHPSTFQKSGAGAVTD